MTREGRQKAILAGLAGVLVVVLLGQWVGGSSKPAGPRAPRRDRGGPASGGELATEQVVALDLEALEPAAGTFEVGRNPFLYAPRPAPPPPPAPPTVKEPPKPPPPPPVAEEEGPRPPSPEHLEYLGSFGPAGRRVAVIVDGEEILNVPEGGVVEGKFIVEEIGYESVAIGFVGFPDAPPERLAAGGAQTEGSK